ncbi:oxidative stress 3 [Rhynchospora pubera]|uniref:Oxidative stress 3 n=1 Tax=Rhynchospora pubera TaxID=906938 RepID=A0AAV8CTF3_9POAL|nr:oxidative stress 3 [Rhynchospora pubera]
MQQHMDTSVIMQRMAQEEDDDIGSMSSFSDHEDSSNSVGSSASSEVTEDASSSNSSLSSSSSSFQPPSMNDQFNQGPLFEMSDLISDLPIKRGLSKFFEGKSQSFTSLTNARNLEDLVKPERPYSKRMKYCKSYAGGLDRQKSLSPKHPTKGAIMKKTSSKGSFGSFGLKKRSFSGLKSSMPPIPRSGCLSSQALLFA